MQAPSSSNHPPPKAKGGWLVATLVGTGVAMLLIALILPALQPAERGRRHPCINNLKQIAIALHSYHDIHGTFPPAYTVDAEGNRLHSWRTLILPYAEERYLYESIDMSKPWDDPVNAEARATAVPFYRCPDTDHDSQATTYLAVIGPGCAFAGATGRAIAEITDGTAFTIVIIDVPEELAVPWMSPHDVSLDEILAIDTASQTQHTQYLVAAYADAHVSSVPLDIDRDTLRALLTIDAGDEVEGEWD